MVQTIKPPVTWNRNPPAPSPQPAQRGICEIVGVVKRIVFTSNEFKIFTLESGENCRCVSDPDNEIVPQLTFRLTGKWSNHPKFGRQFTVDSFSVDTPLNKAGVIAFLTRYVEGIGPITAKKLWDRYGASTIEMLRDNPWQIAKGDYLSNEVAQEVSATLKATKECERTRLDLLGLFAGRGFSKKLVGECVALWGSQAAEIIRRDPFKLMVARLTSAGFKRCDKLHVDLQLPQKRLKRQMLAIWYKLRNDSNGHTWHEINSLLFNRRAVELGTRAGWLRIREEGGKKFIAERDKADNEQQIAAQVDSLLAYRPTLGDQSATLWPSAEQINGLDISEHQKQKLIEATSKPVGLLIGTPGTGKTFTIASLIKLLTDTHGVKAVSVVAPTGKAAVRVADAMQRYGVPINATTIHRLLQIKAGSKEQFVFGAGKSNPIGARYLFVDEASMMDTDIASALMQALKCGVHVLFVGDVNQLPPVGHGSPLRDLIDSGTVACGELTEIQRNSGMIVEACASIKSGNNWAVAERYEPSLGHNLRHFEMDGEHDQASFTLDIHDTLAGLGFDPIWDIQVLTALNDKGAISRKPLNSALQRKLNPDGYQFDGVAFRVGDKVICQKNSILRTCGLGVGGERHRADHYRDGMNSDQPIEEFVANGEIGKVIAVGNKQVIVEFFSPKRVCRVLCGLVGDLESESEVVPTGIIDLAYAITVHKSQGSESPVILIPVDENAKTVCSREHVYTAISRAKKLCVTIGKQGVLRNFCRNVAIKKRKTFLKELLQKGSAE